MKTEIRCRRVDYDEAIDFLVRVIHDNGMRSVAEPLTFRNIEPGQLIGPPTLTVPIASAQQLMDELWDCGLRPTEGKGSAGSLAATERHLKDMQQIAFGLLKGGTVWRE